MNYEQIIDEILFFAIQQNEKENNGNYIVNINSLIRHFSNKFPDLDPRPIQDMINEIDARGWLIQRNSLTLVFDPATFE